MPNVERDGIRDQNIVDYFTLFLFNYALIK